VREALGLSEEHLIWEIEVPMSDGTAPLVFRIVDTGETGAGLTSRHESGPIEIDGVVCEAVYLRSNPSFQGCLKAYLAAKERPVALANFIAGYPEAPTPSA